MPKRKRAKAKARREAAQGRARAMWAHVTGAIKAVYSGLGPETVPPWPQDAPRRVRPLSTP